MQRVRRPRYVIYFMKAMINSFQALIFPKYIFPKCIFKKCIFQIVPSLRMFLALGVLTLINFLVVLWVNSTELSIIYGEPEFFWNLSNCVEIRAPIKCPIVFQLNSAELCSSRSNLANFLSIFTDGWFYMKEGRWWQFCYNFNCLML